MRRTRRAIGALLLILMAGCVRSLHPVYTDQDVIFDEKLVGCWSEENSEESWEFSKQNEKNYQLVYTVGGQSGTFDVHLFKIEGELFLDLFPKPPELPLNDFFKSHLFPVHTFAHIKQIEPTLQMRFPDPDWIQKLVTERPKEIRYEKIDRELVVTASTKEMQAFWLKHLDTEKAFGKLSNMQRKTESPKSEDKK